jgi:Ca-activated chloride channel family protein
MRPGLFLLLYLWPFAAFAQEGDPAWQELLSRAAMEKKPVVVFFKPADCARCPAFESASLTHPTIERRLPAVVFAIRPADEPGVAFFDRAGKERMRWPLVPDTTNFGIILDSVLAVAPLFERAVELQESGKVAEAELAAAAGYARLGRKSAARESLERARATGGPETKQAAIAAAEALDAPAPKPQPARKPVAGAIRILPLERQVVSGKQRVRTHISSANVERVAFSLDGRELLRVSRPPFSAAIDFGKVPDRHVIRVVAFDAKGEELGRDERVVNEAGETFWLRLMSPREDWASGVVRISMNVRAPAARRVQRVVVSWNDAERAVLQAAPWETTVEIPERQVGVLRAFAELDDGRTSEDAVLLNAGGAMGAVDVQLVELPITVLGASAPIAADRIKVREGKQTRRVEAVSAAAETPLTVGVLIDVSDSMQKSLPDVQEAAIRFLESMLAPRDRAFFVAFNTRARLVQPATADTTLLRRQIMKLRPDGLTALNDAMVLGLLQFEGIKGRRALIVFSDGRDITSRYDAAEVAALARRVNVPVHVITSETHAELENVTRSTGGTHHVITHLRQLPAVYAQIESALRAQFLAFVRTEPATKENEWREVEVEVTGEALQVFAPEGYYASW